MTARVVAVDGPAGSGKSTVSRAVADTLGLHTLDTGAMYRCITLAALERGIALDDEPALVALAEGTQLDLGDGLVRLDGRDVSVDIRGPEVTGAVSAVARCPGVRAVLVARQRDWVAAHNGGVVEGRDIGTVVLPDAPVKVFLTAREDVRAARRQRDEEAAERAADADVVRSAIDARDAADASLGRALRPEDAAPDALVIDTTTMTIDDVVATVVERARMAA